jgi:hypothetical protein
MGSLTDQ